MIEHVTRASDDINPPSDDINPPSDVINPRSDDINPPSDDVNPLSDDVNPPSDDINPPFEDLNTALLGLKRIELKLLSKYCYYFYLTNISSEKTSASLLLAYFRSRNKKLC